VADASAAIRLRPDWVLGYNNRALAYLRMGRTDLAQPDFDRTILLAKNYGNALINREAPMLTPAP
jgi:Tfp pilus assembly protein PilF